MTGARVRRFGHACVRIEVAGTVVVIDPGIWSEPEAVVGADAILLTHGHNDHADPDTLRDVQAPVFGPTGVAVEGVSIVPVRAGDTLVVSGVPVNVFGGRHAQVVAGVDSGPNLGFLVAGVCHPGDALDPPGMAVDTLCVPLQASWLKTEEAMAFLQAVAPQRAFGIHDGQVNERGIAGISRWLSSVGRFEWLAPGTWLPAGR